jgi:site-specific DNA-methyltransferase (adenine-specific)
MYNIEDIKNTVICGDCIEVMKQLPDKCVDLVLTDPPYFLPVQHYVGTRDNGFSKRTLGDTSVLSGYFAVIFGELARISKLSATWYIFCDGQSYPIFYREMFSHVKYVRPIVWDKIVSYNGYTWRHQHELIAWGEGEEAKRVPTGDGDIIKCRGVLQGDRNHPAEKPIELIEKLLSKHETGLAIDPFLGSGTTAVACKRTGRNFIGIEISPAYCEIARQRIIQAETGVSVKEQKAGQKALFSYRKEVAMK